MKVGQIFYGRGKGGYGVLGVSASAEALAETVQELCQSVGTPGYERKEDDKPFLLQKVTGQNVIMVCGRTGEPDSVGRKTMFFHAIVVPREYAVEKHISAYDLYGAGLFAETCCIGPLEEVDLPEIASGTSSAAANLVTPAVVRCRRSENFQVISLFLGQLVGRNWASISWSPLEGFDFYGIDESRSISGVSGDYRIYDVGGALLRDRFEKKADAVGTPIARKDKERADKKKCGVMKSIAFGVVGIALGAVAGRMFVSEPRQEVVDIEKVTSEIEAKVKTELGFKMKDEAIAALRPELEKNIRAQLEKEYAEKVTAKPTTELPVFDERYRIVDFKKQMAELDPLWTVVMIKRVSGKEKERRLLEKIQWYVDFVNENFKEK